MIAWIKRRKPQAAAKRHAQPQHHGGHQKPARGKSKGSGSKAGKKASARKIPRPKPRTVAA